MGPGSTISLGDGKRNIIDGGGSGSDQINGAGGNDVLYGPGYLTGGDGNDRFVFDEGRLGNILDLSNGDAIDLSRIDADTTIAGDQAFTVTTVFPGNDAHGVAYLYEPVGLGTTFLYLYIDGNAANADEGAIIIDGSHKDFTNFVL